MPNMLDRFVRFCLLCVFMNALCVGLGVSFNTPHIAIFQNHVFTLCRKVSSPQSVDPMSDWATQIRAETCTSYHFRNQAKNVFPVYFVVVIYSASLVLLAF